MLFRYGGLELYIHIAEQADREHILSSARLMGWEAERDREEEEAGEERDFSSETCKSMALMVSMPRAWLPVHCLLLPGHSELQRSTYCYYRYKLYDQEAFCSELKHPALEEGEEDSGRAGRYCPESQFVFHYHSASLIKDKRYMLFLLLNYRNEMYFPAYFGCCQLPWAII